MEIIISNIHHYFLKIISTPKNNQKELCLNQKAIIKFIIDPSNKAGCILIRPIFQENKTLIPTPITKLNLITAINKV